jgi:pimeloyl-ACP methyl ester carboxylesterase
MMHGVPDLDRYVEELSRPGALTSALNWYRANAKPWQRSQQDIPNVTAPTLGMWGSRDFALTERQMVDSGEFVDAPFRYERLEAGHWLMLQRPDEVNQLLLEFLGSS